MLNRTVMWLTWRQLLVRRRLIAAIMLALAPGLIAALFRSHQNVHSVPSDLFLYELYSAFVVGVVLPLTAVIFGTGAFGLDMDEGTLVYLLVKPLPRWTLVFSRYVVAVGATAAVMVPGIVLPWVIVGTGTVPFSTALAVAAGAGAGCLLYCALFLPLGIASKRALVIGLLYIVVLEEVISRQFAGARALSIREYAASITNAITQAVHPGPVASLTGTFVPVSLSTVWVMGTVVLVGGLAIAIRKLAKFEAAERL